MQSGGQGLFGMVLKLGKEAESCKTGGEDLEWKFGGKGSVCWGEGKTYKVVGVD